MAALRSEGEEVGHADRDRSPRPVGPGPVSLPPLIRASADRAAGAGRARGLLVAVRVVGAAAVIWVAGWMDGAKPWLMSTPRRSSSPSWSSLAGMLRSTSEDGCLTAEEISPWADRQGSWPDRQLPYLSGGQVQT